MLIIKGISDAQRLAEITNISAPLASHLKRKITNLRNVLEPETPLVEFRLVPQHGLIAILTREDQDLSCAGLPKDLSQVIPELVSRLQLQNETYYVVYIVADNDFVIQVYLHEDFIGGKFRTWLHAQPMEEEADEEMAGGVEHESDVEPF